MFSLGRGENTQLVSRPYYFSPEFPSCSSLYQAVESILYKVKLANFLYSMEEKFAGKNDHWSLFPTQSEFIQLIFIFQGPSL